MTLPPRPDKSTRARRWPAWAVGLLCLSAAVASAVQATTEATPDAPRATLRERWVERLAGRTEAASAAPESTAAAAPGTHTLVLQQGGMRRTYLLHIPAAYRAAAPSALVLAFHGGGGHAEHMADDNNYGLIGTSDREGFVIAFPNGFSKFPGGRFATWNAGGCCGDARDKGVDDVAFARAVVADIQARLHIDPRRVFATGMSNGGMMAHRLACDAPDVFRAVASVAGTDATALCQPSQPVSVLHIHARDDDHVLFEGGAGPGAFRDASKVMAFRSVAQTMSAWAQREHCSAAPARPLERPGAYCEQYPGCAGGVQVQLCVTAQGGHAWPGAPSVRRGKPAASTALDANDVIWDFFRSSAAQ
jgi:polyhydroxybutyrate depolymerase